jgi:Domain of unknown function (DUF4920)
MKQLILILSVVAMFSACAEKTNTDAHATLVDSTGQAVDAANEEAEIQLPEVDATGAFGAAITADGAVAATDLVKQLGKADSLHVKVKGEIISCCQAKGCWMTMPLAGKEEMMVKFKDYGFFVPRGAAGKEAIVDGWAYRELVTVDELRHYAEDEGKSKEEIEKITKPEERITFMADGVIIAPSAEGAH